MKEVDKTIMMDGGMVYVEQHIEQIRYEISEREELIREIDRGFADLGLGDLRELLLHAQRKL